MFCCLLFATLLQFVVWHMPVNLGAGTAYVAHKVVIALRKVREHLEHQLP